MTACPARRGGLGPRTVIRGLGSTLCVLGCLVAATGCYTYRPITPAVAAPGTAVRTRLSAEGMVRLESFFGQPQRTVTGEVVEANQAELLLLARTPLQEAAFDTRSRLRQRVLIQQQEIVEAEVRLLDRGRTAGVVGVLTVGAVALIMHFLGGESRGRVPRPPDPGDPT